ncbi:hypothetical protein CSUI_006903 [Cystoisospora suis]|uniref:Transmembrane protein n=1 Tax=Cystoisospora suis TaxID=483139 RepID=A0A2C6KFJ9_9APIC|nr:hypothetical protein CSUI_006903 [Cystoisospora suis]
MQRKSSSTSAMAVFSITILAVLWWCLADISGVSCLAPQARQHSLTEEDFALPGESILDDETDFDFEVDGSDSEDQLPEVSPYAFAEGGSHEDPHRFKVTPPSDKEIQSWGAELPVWLVQDEAKDVKEKVVHYIHKLEFMPDTRTYDKVRRIFMELTEKHPALVALTLTDEQVAAWDVAPPAWLVTASEETKKKMDEHFAFIKGKTRKAQAFTLGMMKKLFYHHLKEHPEQLGYKYWLHDHTHGGHPHHHKEAGAHTSKDDSKAHSSKDDSKGHSSKDDGKGHASGHEGKGHKPAGDAKAPKRKHEGAESPKGGKKSLTHGPTRL